MNCILNNNVEDSLAEGVRQNSRESVLKPDSFEVRELDRIKH